MKVFDMTFLGCEISGKYCFMQQKRYSIGNEFSAFSLNWGTVSTKLQLTDKEKDKIHLVPSWHKNSILLNKSKCTDNHKHTINKVEKAPSCLKISNFRLLSTVDAPISNF